MFGSKLKKLLGKKEENESTEITELDRVDVSKKEGNNKRKIENLVFFVAVLIITIIIINVIWNDKKTSSKQETNTNSKQLAGVSEQSLIDNSSDESVINNVGVRDALAKDLEAILSKIQGVGDVSVFVNYSETSEVVAMYNENSKVSNTEETDKSGGIRKIQETDTQKDVVYKEYEGEKVPITQKVIQPKVEGAIITAKGAENMTVKTSIIQAVEAVTGLATHKIQVFEMN